MKHDEKKCLVWGIIGGILTMIGDCLLLGVDSTSAGSGTLDNQHDWQSWNYSFFKWFRLF